MSAAQATRGRSRERAALAPYITAALVVLVCLIGATWSAGGFSQ